jgi:uncharacterized protein (TIGR00369 family)
VYTPANPDYRGFVQNQFDSARFIQILGIELVDCGPGWCETRLPLRDDLKQQDGFAHAGVVTTLADHSSGMATGTLSPADRKVLTVELKINLLRPGVADVLRCRAEVVKPGKTLTVVEARVFGGKEDDAKPIALMTATMALVE